MVTALQGVHSCRLLQRTRNLRNGNKSELGGREGRQVETEVENFSLIAKFCVEITGEEAVINISISRHAINRDVIFFFLSELSR